MELITRDEKRILHDDQNADKNSSRSKKVTAIAPCKGNNATTTKCEILILVSVTIIFKE